MVWILARDKDLGEDEAKLKEIEAKLATLLPEYHHKQLKHVTHQGRRCNEERRPKWD